jgi:hypothetical protein
LSSQRHDGAALELLQNPPMKMKPIRTVSIPLFSSLVICVFAFAGSLRAAPPTVADVGDPDTFGRAAQFMGVGSGFVQLATTCSATPTPTPPFNPNDSQCFAIAAAPATTTFDAEDICRIKLPKKSTKNIIYPVINLFLNYQLQNSSGVTQPSALFTFSAFLSIESDVLNNPSIIDPGTGLPAAGKFTLQFPYTFRDDRTMQNGDRQRIRETLVRVGNAGLNRQFFIASGLTDNQVDDLFKSVITVRMSIQGTARFVTDANITGNMRLFGD